jgi:hypothetical protein
MLTLLISMGLLGLAAIDPIGIALVLLLLIQEKPYRRSLLFLGGSFFAILCIGVLFAKGLGIVILRTEHHHHWLEPGFQLVAGLLLLIFALYSYMRLRQGKHEDKPNKHLLHYVEAQDFLLFIYGFVLVIIQSIIDVIFVVAMTHIAGLRLHNVQLIVALFMYAVAALSIQIIIVIIYACTPQKHRNHIISKCNKLLDKYGSRITINIGLILGGLLLVNGLLITFGLRHF